jgi:hypothetical protein
MVRELRNVHKLFLEEVSQDAKRIWLRFVSVGVGEEESPAITVVRSYELRSGNFGDYQEPFKS